MKTVKGRKAQADYVTPSKSTREHSSNEREKSGGREGHKGSWHPGEKWPGSYEAGMAKDGRADGGPHLQGGTNQGRVHLDAHDPGYVPDYSTKGQAYICPTFPSAVAEEHDEYLGGYRK